MKGGYDLDWDPSNGEFNASVIVIVIVVKMAVNKFDKSERSYISDRDEESGERGV